MIYVKAEKVGKFAQTAADKQLSFTLTPSAHDDRVRVTGPQEHLLFAIAVGLKAVPDDGERWPGDTRSAP